MLELYADISYHIPGQTYFAADAATYYLIDAKYVEVEDYYELVPMSEVDMPAYHIRRIDQPLYADTYDDAVDAIAEYAANFPDIVNTLR